MRSWQSRTKSVVGYTVGVGLVAVFWTKATGGDPTFNGVWEVVGALVLWGVAGLFFSLSYSSHLWRRPPRWD